MLFTVNPPTTGDQTQSAFKMAAIKVGGVQFKQDALVAQNPPPQVASTITVNVNGNGGNVAAGQPTPVAGGQSLPQGTVVPGQGTLGNGQPCGCQCLCGAGQPVPAGVGQGSFGGFAGKSTAKTLNAEIIEAADILCFRRQPQCSWRNGSSAGGQTVRITCILFCYFSMFHTMFRSREIRDTDSWAFREILYIYNNEFASSIYPMKYCDPQ